MKNVSIACLFAGLLALASCNNNTDENLFEAMPATKTGIGFVNRILEKKELNIFNYRNFYNGGGVAIGDVNNDGWADVYVTSNFEQNKLYLNKGAKTPWQFEDATEKAGVGGTKAWSTGVTFADVNGDGLMDIYVCNSGNIKGDSRGNELFINQGIGPDGTPKFAEKAQEYGVVDGGFSTHAAFFDYDRDGDLDMYLLNNSFTPIDKLGYQNFRNLRDKLGGDKLFRNETIKDTQNPQATATVFTDVSEQAGIYGSLIGFGLGITIGDVNQDNWPDIYISNDFYERDYLYLNQQNGTFKESLEASMNHISASSMGADIADINNDGLLDIFVTDMLPQSDVRLKTTSVFEGDDITKFKLKQGYWHQYMHNMLHLNTSLTGNKMPNFVEVAQFAGVHATDWSWGALIFDMDSDGNKDIFVANGIVKDLTDQDYVAFLADQSNMQAMIDGKIKFDYRQFVAMIASTPVSNYAFRNKGGLQFENKAASWGLGNPGFSNGAAYGDLDNDGDVDLVVNNNNAPLGVFNNQSVQRTETHFLRVKLKGKSANPNAIGAKVYLYQKNATQYLQQMPNRGFQSSSDLNLVFGLGNQPAIDSIRVIWPDDKMQVLRSVKADTELKLDQLAANQLWTPAPLDAQKKPFEDLTVQIKLDFVQQENDFIDYNRDGLLKQMYSTQGPALAVGDVNADGLDDVYLGGAASQKRALFVQQPDGTFQNSSQPAIGKATAEETAATFFDADGDKDLDLYVVTGGNEFVGDSPALLDYLYLNDGKGNFSLGQGLPKLFDNGSCVAATDFDRDGDQDLFVGSRMVSGQYGRNPASRLLMNDGKANFSDQTRALMPQAQQLGMVTDAKWTDIDRDGLQDLMIVGDWMPILIYRNLKGKQLILTEIPTLSRTDGWWNCIEPADIDNDGDVDFVLGNLGRNTKMIASNAQPAELYVNDFDRNGSVEQIISCYNADGKSYPMVLKPDLQKVLPVIKKRFVKHKDYAGRSIDELFSSEQRKGGLKKRVYQPNTCLLLNNTPKGSTDWQFEIKILPLEAQLSPIFGIVATDYDHDGKLDLLLTGNFFDVLPEIGRYDANTGLLLKGNGKGDFSVVKPEQSGFLVSGQVRKMKKVSTKKGSQYVVLAKNGDKAQVFGWK